MSGETFTYPADPHLVWYPDPMLRTTCAPVTDFDDGLRAFCQKMFALMDEHKGVGLAAPQVGVAKRIFVTDHTAGDEEALPDRRVWINPRLEQAQGRTTYEEGCLSIPAVFGKVERANSLDVVYQDERGREHRVHLDVAAGDFLGIIVQHEHDHLDGILHIDHLDAPSLSLVRRKLKDLEKAYKKRTGRAGSVLRR